MQTIQTMKADRQEIRFMLNKYRSKVKITQNQVKKLNKISPPTMDFQNIQPPSKNNSHTKKNNS